MIPYVLKRNLLLPKKLFLFSFQKFIENGFFFNLKFKILNNFLGLSCLNLHCGMYSTFVFLFLE